MHAVCLGLEVGRGQVENRVLMVLPVVMATEVLLVSLVKMVLVAQLWFEPVEGSSLDHRDPRETLGTLAPRVPLALSVKSRLLFHQALSALD